MRLLFELPGVSGFGVRLRRARKIIDVRNEFYGKISKLIVRHFRDSVKFFEFVPLGARIFLDANNLSVGR